MAKIFVLTGPDVGLERDVESGALFGRDDDCRVCLRDPSISRRHARLERTASGFELVDLESRNGIAKAGVRSPRVSLRHGDEVTLGAVRVRFTDESARPAGVEEIELDLPPAAPVESTAAPTKPRGAAPLVGAARQRAIATKSGILQFKRIEGAAPSLFKDDLGQQSAWLRWALVIGGIALSAGLFYASWRIASSVTPAPRDKEAATPEPAAPR